MRREAPSAFDMRHNFVASYNTDLPLERLFGRTNVLTEGWSVSGTTRFSSGFPVTLYNNTDTSLLGTFGNGVNNNLLDTPNYTPAAISTINHDPARARRSTRAASACRRSASSATRRAGSSTGRASTTPTCRC